MQSALFYELLYASWQTIVMVFISGFIALVLGIPLGVILITTRKNAILANQKLNTMLAMIVNAVRSIPFIILLVALIPFTRFLVHTSIGTLAAMVPLTIGAIPFIGRIVENSLEEVSGGLIEAGL